MLTSTALVLLMIPGLAMFYGGLVRTKNVLGTMMHCFAAMAIVGVLWVVCGYSMSFGSNVLGGWFGWDSRYLFLRGIDDTIMEEGIPEYVFAMFQGKFAIITPALIAGAFAERVRFSGYCLFITLWSLIVYNPLCHWVWAEDGFLFNLGANGAIDFAGGTVVHISAGVSALVAVLYLGARRGYPQSSMHPSNLVITLMGVGLLWVGWFGFNAGSSVSSGLDTARALTVTQVAAAAGALSWMFIETIKHGKATSLGVACGILAGLGGRHTRRRRSDGPRGHLSGSGGLPVLQCGPYPQKQTGLRRQSGCLWHSWGLRHGRCGAAEFLHPAELDG